MSAAPTFQSTIQQILSSAAPPSVGSFMKGAFGSNPVSAAFGQATDAANMANFNRGQQAIGLLAGQGNASKTQNQQIYNQNLGQIDQDMMNRGIYNTTVGADMKQASAEQLARSNASVNEGVAGNVANALLSFQDKGPDMGLLADLLSKGGGNVNTGGMFMGSAPRQPTGGVIMAGTQPGQWH